MNENQQFLLYTAPDGAVKVEVYFKDETVWLTQKTLAELFGVKVPAVNKYLRNIFESGELVREATVSKMEIVRSEGARDVVREVEFYNLDAIIAVGYRVNSYQATRFRIWATQTLREFIVKGFILDDERLKQGKRVFGKDYFDELLERIREIRASERRFYQKITDIYALSADYDPQAPVTKDFFATVQNNRIVSAYLDLAENRAARGVLTRMAEWAEFLNRFLELSNYPILQDKGKASALEARLKAEGEYEVFRKLQDQDYISDFDREIERLEGEK